MFEYRQQTCRNPQSCFVLNVLRNVLLRGGSQHVNDSLLMTVFESNAKTQNCKAHRTTLDNRDLISCKFNPRWKNTKKSRGQGQQDKKDEKTKKKTQRRTRTTRREEQKEQEEKQEEKKTRRTRTTRREEQELQEKQQEEQEQ